MPQKMRRAAVLSALSAKAGEQAIKVIETITLAQVSTKEFRRLLDTIGLTGKTLLLLPVRDETLALSARNLPDVHLQVLPGLSTYQVLNAGQILVTRAALDKLTAFYTGDNGTASSEQRAASGSKAP
jgi:large subunit ribosomal protein L4